MDSWRYEAFARVAGGASPGVRALVLELLKQGERSCSIRSGWVVAPAFMMALVCALVLFLLECAHLILTRKSWPGLQSHTLFGSSPEQNTSNQHLRRLLAATDSELDVLMLDSPLKGFHKAMSAAPRVREHWCRSVTSDLQAAAAVLRDTGPLLNAMLSLDHWVRADFKSTLMCLVRLLRGYSIARCLSACGLQRIVFTLSGNACTAVIEQRLNGEVLTIHWLHGAGMGFNFDSFSDLTLVNNSYDHRFYKDKLCGDSLFFPRVHDSGARRPGLPDVNTLVVFSNLIHPGNAHFLSLGFRVEQELLELVAAEFAGWQLKLKPHPVSFSTLGEAGAAYREFVQAHGFEFLNEPVEPGPGDALYISSVSTSYIDLLAAGKQVLLYEGFAHSQSGFQDDLPRELKFHDRASLARARAGILAPGRSRATAAGLQIQSLEQTSRYLLAREQPC